MELLMVFYFHSVMVTHHMDTEKCKSLVAITSFGFVQHKVRVSQMMVLGID